MRASQVDGQRRGQLLDADTFVKTTYVNVLRQQLVGHFVLLQDVVVGSHAGEGRAEEKAEHSVERKNRVSEVSQGKEVGMVVTAQRRLEKETVGLTLLEMRRRVSVAGARP